MHAHFAAGKLVCTRQLRRLSPVNIAYAKVDHLAEEDHRYLVRTTSFVKAPSQLS